MPETAVADEESVPIEYDRVYLDDHRLVEQMLVTSMSDGSRGSVLPCQEPIEVRTLADRTEIVAPLLAQASLRLFFWNGVLAIETSDGYLGFYRRCSDRACADRLFEIPSEVFDCRTPPELP